MGITAGTTFFVCVVFLGSLGKSSGMPPKLRNFLGRVGEIDGEANCQESISRSKIFLDDDAMYNVPSSESSASSSHRHPPNTTLSLAISHSPLSSSRLTEPSPPARSRVSILRETFPCILGYPFDQLEDIRLSPLRNLNRIFELRKYAFPPGTQIRLRANNSTFIPLPTEEQIVLSTSVGDACAILAKKRNRQICFRGMYTSTFYTAKRAKININSGEVGELTPEEIMDSPISGENSIRANFKVFDI